MLAAVLVGIASPAGAIWPFSGRGAPDPDKDLAGAAAQLLSRAIRIRTVNPPGDERALAKLYVEFLRDQDIEARMIKTPPREAKTQRGLAWGRVEGSGEGRPLVLLSHLDVVAANPAEWKVDPFAGEIVDGYVIGRGALDAKGIGIVHLLTMAALARRENPLPRDIIFLATPDEEDGGREGAGWVVDSQREILDDAEYLLTEGGGILLGDAHGPPLWGVSFAEKAPCWMEVVARGTPGHSSSPARDAAVPRLVAALEHIRTMETPIRVTPEVARMFAEMSPYVDAQDHVGYMNLASALRDDSAFRSRFLADRGHNALVRNTVTITVLEGSPATNVLAATARAHLDARLLPGDRCSDFVDRVRATVGDPGVQVEPILAFPSRSSPIDTPLMEAIHRVAAEVDGNAVVIPRVIAGFTDSHYFRDLGIVSYGFVPRWLPASETLSIHGTNERISIQNLERGVRTMIRILEELGP